MRTRKALPFYKHEAPASESVMKQPVASTHSLARRVRIGQSCETASLAIPARQLSPESDGAHIRLVTGRHPIHLPMVEVERIDGIVAQ
jgi:hypothetical protein